MDSDPKAIKRKQRRRKAHRAPKRPSPTRLAEAMRWRGATVAARLKHYGVLAIEAACLEVEFGEDNRLYLLLRPVRGSGGFWLAADDCSVLGEPLPDVAAALPVEAWNTRRPIADAPTHAPAQKRIVLPAAEPATPQE